MSLPDLGSSLPDIALRTSIIYLVLIVLLRVGGKRGIGQMSIVDLVLVLIIANGVQNAMVGQNTTIYGGIVAAATLVILDWVIRGSPIASSGRSGCWRASRHCWSGTARC